MKAVILAAGKGTRLRPLTETRPKPLIPIANKSILEWNLDALNDVIDEAIIIIGYKGEMIKEKLGMQYRSIKLTYVEQKEQKGTGHAIQACEHLVLGERFIVMNGDDLFSQEDIKRCVKHDFCVLAKEVDDPQNYGALEVDGNKLIRIDEKSAHPKSNLVNVGLYVVDAAICSIDAQLSSRGEIEITQLVNDLVGAGRRFVVEQVQEYWFPVSYPWSILEANKAMLEHIKKNIRGTVEEGATIKGEVIIGEGTLVRGCSYIEGPVVIGKDCVIGPNCYIRSGTTLGDGCKVGNAVEIKNSVLFEKVSVGHLSYFGDSVIGERTNIGAGTISANLRHDEQSIKVMVNGKLVDSGRRKLGAIIGAEAHTGINTSLYPGRVIPPRGTTKPGEIFK